MRNGENMQWGKKDATDEEIWEALKTAQAEEFIRAKEGGLDANIEQEDAIFPAVRGRDLRSQEHW